MLLCRNKSPPWSKSKVRLVEINYTSYSRNVGFFFKKEYTNHNIRRYETSSQKIMWCFNLGSIIRVALFFPWPRFFSHWVFLARFLMRQQIVRIKRYVYSFSFTRIFSHRVFPSKVFNEAHYLWTSKGECYKFIEWVDSP